MLLFMNTHFGCAACDVEQDFLSVCVGQEVLLRKWQWRKMWQGAADDGALYAACYDVPPAPPKMAVVLLENPPC